MAILVYAEHDNASLKKATLNTIAAAKQIGDDVHVLVAGSGAQAAADAAAKAEGVTKVLLADNAAYEHQLAGNIALLVADIAGDYSNLGAQGHWRQTNWTKDAPATHPPPAIGLSLKVVPYTRHSMIMSGSQLKIIRHAKRVKNSFQRHSKHEDQFQTWCRCWNYETRILNKDN